MFDMKIMNEAIKRLKKQSVKCWTNCFFTADRLISLSKNMDTRLYIGKRSICFIYDERDFSRVCYWIADIDAVKEIYDVILKHENMARDIIIELVGFAKDIYVVETAFLSYGLIRYAMLHRWRLSRSMGGREDLDDAVIYKPVSEKSDVKIIEESLNQNFDPYISHLPTAEYLYKLQADGLIYGAYIHHKLIAFFCLENLGSRGKYFYEGFVCKKYRNQRIGEKLAHYIISRHPECSSFVLWIEGKNLASQKLFEKLGFKQERLQTVVLKYNNRNMKYLI